MMAGDVLIQMCNLKIKCKISGFQNPSGNPHEIFYKVSPRTRASAVYGNQNCCPISATIIMYSKSSIESFEVYPLHLNPKP
jgi:hypothetical protein